MTSEDDANPETGVVPVVELALGAINTGDYIRMAGINEDHARVLAERDGDLPPIEVQGGTMRVIDGVHRVRAAELRGDSRIRARIVDLSDQEAFMASVAANIAHGLPLSLSDRKAAAARMIDLYPQWSDRALSRACGLSARTVGALRARSANEVPQRRIGLDGRSRPMDGGLGRRVAGDLLRARPDAPLRQIAREAGVSPGTVRKVRDSMDSGKPSRMSGEVPRSARTLAPAEEHVTPAPTSSRFLPLGEAVATARTDQRMPDTEWILHNLRQDPSLIYRSQGRDLLRLLQRRPVLETGKKVIDAIPSHCLPLVAALTRRYAEEWTALTGMLERRARNEAA